MKTPASICGHPLHPMLIPFPFALCAFSFISDAIYYFGGYNYVWQTVAYHTLAGGIAGGALAAVPGIIDYFSIKDKKVASIAIWHARANALALALFAASFYLRTDRGSRIVDGSLTVPMLICLLGVMLMFAAGWLGGKLVYRYRVGAEDPTDADGRSKFPRRVA